MFERRELVIEDDDFVGWILTDSGRMEGVSRAQGSGLCLFHAQGKQVYKVTLDHNDAGKWETNA